MAGFVYLATVNDAPNFIKIGKTENDVHRRMRELTDAPNSRGEHTAAYFRRVENYDDVEKELHEKFYFCREQRTEYFNTDWRAVKSVLEMYPEARVITENEYTDDEFITALRNCDLQAVNNIIAGGMNMNLDEKYGWENLFDIPANERDSHGNLYIGKLLAINSECLMFQQGRPIINALITAYIRENPGINNTPIFNHLGIRTAAINGGNNDFFAFGILQGLRNQGIVENRGQPGNPQWYVVENEITPPESIVVAEGILLRLHPDGTITWEKG